MAKRTDEQVTSQQGEKVRLGEKEYEIKPLTIRKAQAWRTKISPSLESMLASEGASASPESLKSALLNSPTEIADLIFDYLALSAEEREEILDSATEAQILGAFQSLMLVAFSPFLIRNSMIKSAIDPSYREKMMDLNKKVTPSPTPSTLQ